MSWKGEREGKTRAEGDSRERMWIIDRGKKTVETSGDGKGSGNRDGVY